MNETVISILVIVVLAIFVLGVRFLITYLYYREMGSYILDMFDTNPVLAWLHYGFTGYFLAQKFGKEPSMDGIVLEDTPNWALSDEEKKMVKGDIWYCPECGMTNPASRVICSCGMTKPK